MLNVQQYLRDGVGTLADLKTQLAISHRRHPEISNLVLLKYDQIDSPMGNSIVQECRGIILDETDWSIISHPFPKFFNAAEGHAALIDWSKARVMEKLDGSLMVMWHYQGEWHVSTSGHPSAGGQVSDFPFTFEKLFWDTFDDLEYEFPSDTSLTYMFELTSKFNRIVCVHDRPNLTLLAVRETATGKELDPSGFPYGQVRSFPMTSYAEILDSYKHIDPIHQEGYVVFDGTNRIKCKAPGYVALHHLVTSCSTKSFLQLIRSGEQTEFLAYYPEYTDQFTPIKASYDTLVAELEAAYALIAPIQVQKEFALEALKTRCSGVMFGLRKGALSTVKQGLASMQIEALMGILKLKE